MTIEWAVPIGQTRSMAIALHTLAADARCANGYIGCSISTELASRGTVRYVEEWQTDGALRRRLQSDTFSQLAMLIADSLEAPRIEFELADGTRGLEFRDDVHSLKASDR